jgi:hypothetical protein
VGDNGAQGEVSAVPFFYGVCMRSTALLFIALIGLVACSDNIAPEQQLAGTYALLTINGRNLPYMLVQSGPAYRIEIADGALVLNSNGTFVETLMIRQTDSTAVTLQSSEVHGTWSGMRDLRLTVDNAAVLGTIAGNTITTSDGEFTLVYRRSAESGRPRP